MSKYVRCVNNQTLLADDLAGDYSPHLVVGRVYKVIRAEENDGDMIRIIDGSGESYLYPGGYFEPFDSTDDELSESITVHLNAYLKGVLQAEAIVAHKSVSALIRDWIDERLDLPVGVD